MDMGLYSILYYIRNDPSILKESLEKRGYEVSIVDKLVELD